MSKTLLFIGSSKAGSRLADVASGVFRVLGVSQFEERLSANYPPDEHYYAGYAQNARVLVYDSEYDRELGFSIGLSVEPPRSWRKGIGAIETNQQRIARLLVCAGFRVFIPQGAMTIGSLAH
jgi:hypothetical protein